MIASSSTFSAFELLAGLPSDSSAQNASVAGSTMFGASTMEFGDLLDSSSAMVSAEPSPESLSEPLSELPESGESLVQWDFAPMPAMVGVAPPLRVSVDSSMSESAAPDVELPRGLEPVQFPSGESVVGEGPSLESPIHTVAGTALVLELGSSSPSVLGGSPLDRTAAPIDGSIEDLARSTELGIASSSKGVGPEARPMRAGQTSAPTVDLVFEGGFPAVDPEALSGELPGPTTEASALPLLAKSLVEVEGAIRTQAVSEELRPLDESVEVRDAMRRVHLQSQVPDTRSAGAQRNSRSTAVTELGQRIAAQVPVTAPLDRDAAAPAANTPPAVMTQTLASIQGVAMVQEATAGDRSAKAGPARDAVAEVTSRPTAPVVSAMAMDSGAADEQSSGRTPNSAEAEVDPVTLAPSTAPTLEISTLAERPTMTATSDLHGAAQRAVADTIVQMAEDKLLASAAPKTATVELSPSHLGRLKIEVVLNSNQGVDVHITASVKQTQLALAAGADDLVEVLRRSSIDVQKVDVRGDAANSDRGQRDLRGEPQKDRDSSSPNRDSRQHSGQRGARQQSSRSWDLTDYRYWEAIR